MTTEMMVANNKFPLGNDVGPASTATQGSPSTSVFVQFDRDVDASSIKTGSVTVISLAGVESGGTGDYDPVPSHLRSIRPRSPGRSNTASRVRVSERKRRERASDQLRLDLYDEAGAYRQLRNQQR
jgi:hypothetical protein